MKILYVLPHPDDESFGPAAAIDKHIKEGHQVHLLTLTRGGATKQRFRLNLTIEQMGEVRYREMLDVKRCLNLTSMTVLDLPDGRLNAMDPRTIEEVVSDYILKINPHILVTYPIHGISGFYDHIVCHAIVKRVFVELRDKNTNLRRLAFFGVSEEDIGKNKRFPIKALKEKEIDCFVKLNEENVQAAHKALDCYTTYKEVIEQTHIKEMARTFLPFEFFQESFDPPIDSLTDHIDA